MGTKERAEQYFSDTFSPSTINLDEVVASLNQHVLSTNEDSSMMAPMTNKEIKNKLCSMSNSAPGRVDPNCKIVGAIFNKQLLATSLLQDWLVVYDFKTPSMKDTFNPLCTRLRFYQHQIPLSRTSQKANLLRWYIGVFIATCQMMKLMRSCLVL